MPFLAIPLTTYPLHSVQVLLLLTACLHIDLRIGLPGRARPLPPGAAENTWCLGPGGQNVPLQLSCKVNLSSAVQVVPAAMWPTCAFELVSFAACATVQAQQQKCSYCLRGYCEPKRGRRFVWPRV